MSLYPIFRLPVCTIVAWLRHAAKPFSIAAGNSAARMPPRLVINEADIEEAFLKGSGPGGQKIVGIFKTREVFFVVWAQLTCIFSPEQNRLRCPT